jgi:hypothetical protein
MKRVGLLLVALLFITAGCVGPTVQTPQEFENNSERVQDLESNESVVAFTLTENAHYTTSNCWFNPATKITQCTYTDHSTDINTVIVEQNDETIRAMDDEGNYEGENIVVDTDGGVGQYTVVMNYESGHTKSFSFNRTESGNIVFFGQ